MLPGSGIDGLSMSTTTPTPSPSPCVSVQEVSVHCSNGPFSIFLRLLAVLVTRRLKPEVTGERFSSVSLLLPQSGPGSISVFLRPLLCGSSSPPLDFSMPELLCPSL